MSHLIRVDPPQLDLALSDHDWTWAWAGDDATPIAWPGMSDFGGVTAKLVTGLSTLIGQPTDELWAAGIGSARVNKAVTVRSGAGAGYVQGDPTSGPASSSFPGIPVDTAFTVRLILKDPHLATVQRFYLRLDDRPNVPQKLLEIGFDGSVSPPLLTVRLGDNPGGGSGDEIAVALPVTQYADKWFLLDVVYEPGVDLGAATPADLLRVFTSGVLASTTQAVSTFVNDDIAPGTPVFLLEEQHSCIFAGIAVGTALTHDQHQLDADRLGIRQNGQAILDFDWDRAYVGDQAAETEWPSFRPFGPPLDADPIRSVTLTAQDLVLELPTDQLLVEGLGKSRLHHAVGSLATARAAGTAPSFDFAQDATFRLLFRANSSSANQTLFHLLDSSGATKILFEKDGAVLNANFSSFAVASALSFIGSPYTWFLVDILYLATGGGGGVTRVETLINGVSAGSDAASAFTGTTGGTMGLLSQVGGTNPADDETALVFFGYLPGTVISLSRHTADLVALGVI